MHEPRLITLESRLGEIDSTMDAAKALSAGQDFLLVTAESQTRGKGTRGRLWKSHPGNLYMTIGINRRHLPPERLALLPLEIGLLLWREVSARLPADSRGKLSLKWPNDLLAAGRKAAGMLMEGHGDLVLAGIGVNVAGAPEVEDGGTPSACLADLGMAAGEKDALASGLYERVKAEFTGGVFDPENVLLEWQAKVDWNLPRALRDRPGRPPVWPVSVNRHGHLQVRHADGSHEWLVSEYLA